MGASSSTVGLSIGGATLGTFLGVKGGINAGLDLGQIAALSSGSEDEVFIFRMKARGGVIGGVSGGIGGGIGGATLGYVAAHRIQN